VAIVSSGHTEYIQAVFKAQGLQPPKILISSDTTRELTEPKRDKFKPEVYLLGLAHFHASDRQGIRESSNTYLGRHPDKQHMMYIGDDPSKDGKLAENARILYGFVPFVKPEFVPDTSRGQVFIPDFLFLAKTLRDNHAALEKGESLSEIFLKKPDKEIFPPVAEGQRPFNRYLRGEKQFPPR